VAIEIFHEFDTPSTLYLHNGVQVLWIRYAEWLMTCPVRRARAPLRPQ